jgi:hypothetical protein
LYDVHQESLVKRRLHGTLGLPPKPAFKFKVVGSPPTLAQRVLNETLWHPAFFCCWQIEAAQGRDGRVSVATVFAAKCRRLGDSLAAGYNPRKKTRGFPPLARRHF